MTADGPTDSASTALRARLAAVDPARPGGPAYLEEPAPDEIEERVMATTAQEPDTGERSGPPSPPSRSALHVAWPAAAAAVVLVAVAVTGVLALRDGGAQEDSGDAVTLTLPVTDGVSSSCAMFDVAVLRQMPLALAGTVTALGDDGVTLQVDRWYRADADVRQADTVTIAVPDANTSAALDGVRFQDGEQYLVTATDGTVNGCGFSGPADPRLEAAYAEAFGG